MVRAVDRHLEFIVAGCARVSGGPSNRGALLNMQISNRESPRPSWQATVWQVELGLDGTPEPSPYGYYQLFIGNMTYLFGAKQPTAGAGVYVLTQT